MTKRSVGFILYLFEVNQVVKGRNKVLIYMG